MLLTWIPRINQTSSLSYTGITKNRILWRVFFLCVWKRGEVISPQEGPSKFGENWVLKHWIYGTSWNHRPAEVGWYSFLWKFTRFFTGVQLHLKKNINVSLSQKEHHVFFFPAPWRDLQSLGKYNYCTVFAEPALTESPSSLWDSDKPSQSVCQ